VHHGERSAQESHELHLALKAHSFHDRVKYLLMERGDLTATLQVRSLEGDEIRLVGEWGGKGYGIARIPRVDHALMDGTDGALVGGNLGCRL
jgi:hypothetical protein